MRPKKKYRLSFTGFAMVSIFKHMNALKKKKKIDKEEQNWRVTRNCKSTKHMFSLLRKEQLAFTLQQELEMQYNPSR